VGDPSRETLGLTERRKKDGFKREFRRKRQRAARKGWLRGRSRDFEKKKKNISQKGKKKKKK